ncbi:MAG: glycosyltransferase [Candidatus Lokiarchaeota archaeon]|nr:glycosyltransferase [Candidatus Lokiarchaeota archaeon]
MAKICFLIGYYPLIMGGSEIQASYLANKLKEKNDIFYISVGHPNERIFSDQKGIKVYTVKIPSLPFIGGLKFLLKNKLDDIFAIEKPDIIYQRIGYSATGFAALFCKRNNCKLVWHIASEQDVKSFKFGFKKRDLINYIDYKIMRYGIKYADIIIAQAKYQKEQLKKNYNRETTIVIPNFHPLSNNKIKKTLPIKIVWISNIKPLKQPELFIQLAEKFKNYNNLQFIMVGRIGVDPYSKKIYNKIKSSNVSYLGEKTIEEVEKILAQAHIFISTSLYEGFPNTFIQAWLHQVPVISLIVDPDDILKTKKIGFHSNLFNRMEEDVKLLINDSKKREEMGIRAQRYALENHSMANIEKIIGLMKNA